ncbi:MAG: GFA family protein [Deltaproteobacteria bacterium]|nr:MAG: GFA family protein [Deltaproteobacteria bacterium]TMB16038.1 MAG: GFA family protein [Deltaproteobacteria bacterium]
MTYSGGCHCGRVAFEVDGEIEQVVACNCSICSKRGYLLWFVPREQLRLATPEAELATYTFNTGRVKHHFCPRCGCAPFGIGSDKRGTPTAAINVRCLDGVTLSALKVVRYDGRSL